jgi:hypothetical protein
MRITEVSDRGIQDDCRRRGCWWLIRRDWLRGDVRCAVDCDRDVVTGGQARITGSQPEYVDATGAEARTGRER